MIRYPLSKGQAIRAYMRRIDAAGVTFAESILNQFIADEAAGLASITVDRIPHRVEVSDSSYSETAELQMNITYADPELEMLRRLSC